MKTNLQNLNKNQYFALLIPINEYIYIKELIVYLLKKNGISYNLKTIFLEGLELLKIENPLINNEAVPNSRHYMAGKEKIKTFSTNTLISKENINWINNYISEKRKKDMFFSKADFMTNLVQLLKKKYCENLQD